MPSTTFYADTSGKLFAETGSNRIEVIFTYTISNSFSTITAFTPISYTGPLEIPSTLAGSTVTSIGSGAFNACTKLTSITIPDSVTTIGNQAFYVCAGLTSINIPASVTSIDFLAFSGCRGLTSVTFASGSQLLTIGDRAFETCSKLASIIIPDSVTSIDEDAFSNCSSLETVTFASGSLLTTIGNGAFFSCSSLTSITIPASVESIGFGPFAACSSLASININQSNQNFSSFDGVLYDKPIHTLISYPGGKSGSTFTILSSVKTIGRSAFGSCAGLTSITIQASVESIGDAAFYGCTNLATVTFASNSKLQTFGFAAFYECYKLTSITMPGSVTSIFDNYQFGTFANSGLTIMYIPTINGLGLIPSTTPVTRYGRTFTVTRDVAADAAAAVAAAVPICFPAGTKVTTDQGDIAIENLQPKVYTIRGKKIVGITQTIPLQKHIISIEKDALAKNVPSVTTQISKEHKVFYKGKMVKARDLVEVCQGVTAIPYNGEILYNVLLKKHEKMMVNNLICETLDPENIVAKIYNGNFQPTEKSKICEKLNHIIRTNDIPEYKKLYASLK